jgi:hypothetical protein
MAKPKPSLLDGNQVLQHAFDDETSSLRTNATAIITGDTFAIELDAADGDNVAISDGTNTAQVTTNKELKVKDFESLAKLASIDTRLSQELSVSDSAVLEKLELIEQALTNTGISVSDADSLAQLEQINTKLQAIDTKLGNTLSVSDSEVLTKLEEIQNSLTTENINVSDSQALTKLTSIDNKLSQELTVKDSSVAQILQDIQTDLENLQVTVSDPNTLAKLDEILIKLGTTLSVSDSSLLTELTDIKNLLSTTPFIVKDVDLLNKINDLETSLSSIEFKVKDDTVNSSIGSLENSILTSELQVKDQSSIDLLTSIDNKLDNLSVGGNAQIPEIQNISLATANTEQSIILPTGCKKYTLRVRNNSAKIQLSFSSGESNSNFLTIPRGCSYSEDFVELTTAYNHLYVQSNKNNVTIECISWS